VTALVFAPVRGSQVRIRLAAGGKRIRTLGPAVKSTAVPRRAASFRARLNGSERSETAGNQRPWPADKVERWTLFALAGGLIAWAPDLDEQFRTAARYVDEILRGANPGDLPIRHPSRYYLTVNAGAAKNIGLALPPALLTQADRVLP
jgi:hypothetical protein